VKLCEWGGEIGGKKTREVWGRCGCRAHQLVVRMPPRKGNGSGGTGRGANERGLVKGVAVDFLGRVS
jgi:hypothetical protein